MKILRNLFSFFVIITILLSVHSGSAGESLSPAYSKSIESISDPMAMIPTQTSEIGKYIYDTDFASAQVITEFLASLNLAVEIIHMDEILSIEWAEIGFVVIGADTGAEGSWGASDQITALTTSDIKFLAFGEGGLSFYQNIASLTVIWENSVTETISKIDVAKINTEMWIYPHLFPESFEFYIQDDKTYTLLEGKLDPSVVVHGKSRNSTNPIQTFELDRYYFWGIQSVTELWPSESYKMLDNIVTYLINGGIPVTPNISGPSEINYVLGTVGNTINWVYSYIIFGNYSVYLDAELKYESSTSSGSLISYSIDGLSIGQYTYTIILYSISGVVSINEVIVRVSLEDLFPTLTSPPDSEFWYGETGHILSWIPTDTNPHNYSIYQNDSIIESGNWTSGAPIELNLDEIASGDYNFTLQVFDQSDQGRSDIVNIIIRLDTEIPVISYSGNFTIDEQEPNKTLSWSATDIHPSRYKIYNDTSIIEEGFWDDNKIVVLNVSTFTLGSYNITFAVSDSFGNVAYASKELIIIDQLVPEIKGPTSVYNEPGRTENDIQWVLSDEHPSNYTVLIDGNYLFNGSWALYPFVDVDLSGFSTGVYNFTIIVEDTSRNTAIHIVRVYIDMSMLTTASAEGGSSSPGIINIKTEYVVGAGFVATIFVVGSFIRRRSG